MNILWITNTIFPAPSKALGLGGPAFEGWTYGPAMRLATTPDVHLIVATVYPGEDLKVFEIDGVVYYLLPATKVTKYQPKLEKFWKIVCDKVNPDIIHIHGTEFTHGLACIKAYPETSFVVSIQGLVGVYARYYLGGISFNDILRNISVRDLLRLDTIYQGKRKYDKRGEFEREYFRKIKNFIGRTYWDLTHIKTFNHQGTYHFCNESLRDPFYTSVKWNIGRKSDFTIFLSQASYPIKGLHQVIKAVALLLKNFPGLKIRVAGPNLVKYKTITDKLKISGYGLYLRTLIRRLQLSNRITFLGILNAEQMVTEYLNSHVFVCPSSIENSPNSLGEAQLLGVPCIASYVGGIPDMVEHEKTGLLYRFEEVEMLAEQIRRVFQDDNLALYLSRNGIQAAEKRHNPDENLNQLISIYKTILNNHGKIET